MLNYLTILECGQTYIFHVYGAVKHGPKTYFDQYKEFLTSLALMLKYPFLEISYQLNDQNV